MFGFPVSVMILVMVVFGGIGSVWGVVIGAVFLALVQSVFLRSLTDAVHWLGNLVNSGWLQRADLATSTELIFGVILVLMMLYRREGLIPATRRVPRATFDSRTASPAAGFDRLTSQAAAADKAVPLLDIADLTVRFGGLVALRSVSLTVPAGSIVAVIGPNGSGKSTLFNAVTGLVPAQEGRVRFAGAEIGGLLPHVVLEQFEAAQPGAAQLRRHA